MRLCCLLFLQTIGHWNNCIRELCSSLRVTLFFFFLAFVVSCSYIFSRCKLSTLAQYLLCTCTGLTHYWTIDYMLQCFQVEDVEDGWLRLLIWSSARKKRVIFLQSEGFSVFNAKTIPEHERLQICPYRCVIATCNFSTSPFQYTHTHKHPLILPFHSRINPPLHHPLILRPSTYVAHEKWEGGWERRWMKRGAENEREWGGGGGEKSKIGKNALWLDLKVCGISFSERGELHLLQIL